MTCFYPRLIKSLLPLFFLCFVTFFSFAQPTLLSDAIDKKLAACVDDSSKLNLFNASFLDLKSTNPSKAVLIAKEIGRAHV